MLSSFNTGDNNQLYNKYGLFINKLINKYNLNKNNYWIDPTKLQNYTLPTFTKKIVKFLESHK